MLDSAGGSCGLSSIVCLRMGELFSEIGLPNFDNDFGIAYN